MGPARKADVRWEMLTVGAHVALGVAGLVSPLRHLEGVGRRVHQRVDVLVLPEVRELQKKKRERDHATHVRRLLAPRSGGTLR